jgi:hypothetical protein
MQTVTVSGTTLFHVAAAYLNDATQWVRIAQQNNLTDPMIYGVTTLVIPAVDPNMGGGIAPQ